MKNYIDIKKNIIKAINFEASLSEEEKKRRIESVSDYYDKIACFSNAAMNHKNFKLKINKTFLRSKGMSLMYRNTKNAFMELCDMCEKYHLEPFSDKNISDEDLFELSNDIRNQILAKKYDMYSYTTPLRTSAS